MAASCQTVINVLEKLAPKVLASDWDNIGLQTGSPAQRVNRVLLSLDLNLEVLKEARLENADMLVLHHTPFFKPLKNLRADLPAGELISELVKSGIALYVAHTNLDAAWGGVSDALAAKLQLQDISVLDETFCQKLYKLAVFVPHEYLGKVSEAITHAGGGCIGNYSDCTFRINGLGTFRPLEGSDPFLGRQGELEQVEETRLETIVPEEMVPRVLKAMFKAHPYEEVAYDLYPLANRGKTAGAGRVGRLPEPVSLREFVDLVKKALNVKALRYCGEEKQRIEKAAVCGGSGAGYLHAALFAGAGVLLTADVKYHEAQEAVAHKLALVDAGHFATEHPVLEVLAERLKCELAGQNVSVNLSRICTDPFVFA